jgi:hypothetical protein
LLDEATGRSGRSRRNCGGRVPTSRERDDADVYFDEDDLMEYTEEQLRYQQFGPSAEELAGDVAKGSIALGDERIAAVSRLAAKLRAVTIAATRLERLLTVDPKVQSAEYIGCLSEAQSGYVRRDELWTSPAGCFVVRHFFIRGLYGECWEAGWRIMIFAADDDGTIVSLGARWATRPSPTRTTARCPPWSSGRSSID